MVYLFSILIFLFLWSLISGILLIVFDKEKPIDKIKYFQDDHSFDSDAGSRGNRMSILKLMASLIPAFNIFESGRRKVEAELIKADLTITAEELFLIKSISSFTLALAFYYITKNEAIAILIFLILWNFSKVIIYRKKEKRKKLFDSQLSEGINIISNSLKAGYSFLQAMAVVTKETRDPFSKEFKKLLKEMSLGISEEEALNNLLNRVESEDLTLVINAILIQKNIGGNLSEILDNISGTIRDRQKIKNELKTLTAQGKLSGFIVMLIPIFLGLIIYLFNKEYIIVLFNTKIGIGMVAMAIISEFFGFLMIRKIVNISL